MKLGIIIRNAEVEVLAYVEARFQISRFYICMRKLVYIYKNDFFLSNVDLFSCFMYA